MERIFVSCTGVSKSFERAIVPSSLLQDHVLKHRKHRARICIEALRDISLHVKQGEWVGLYGANGSGKTTLLRVLAGLMQPDTGSVQTMGSMSCFFELGVGFHPERKAEENIYIHGLLQGFSPKEIRKQTRDIIEFAGTESHIDLPVKCYSTGMRMRLAFAAAAQVDSDIYLLDEVLAVGDAAFQKRCEEHIRKLHAMGKTAIIVSHDLSQLERLCDHVVHLDHGAVTQIKTMTLSPTHVRAAPLLVQTA